MRVGLVTVGEPLPFEGPSTRLYRTGLLAQALREAGHEVTWWTSAFNHFRKEFHPEPYVKEIEPGYTIRLLKGRGYQRNISWRRYQDHLDVARLLAEELPSVPQPDIFVCSLPVAEHIESVLDFAEPRDIPVVVDARDMWPDIAFEYAPRWALPLVMLGLRPLFRRTERVFRGATGITAHTAAFLEWGLEYADRTQLVDDGVFPFGYRLLPVTSDALEQGRNKWREAGLDPNRFRVLYSGQLIDQLDMGPVWHAARELPQCEFVLAGEGQARAKFERQSSHLQNVRFTGWLNQAELQAAMEISQVGLMPYKPRVSFAASIPNKANEYMANALPIIWSIPYGELAEVLSREACGKTYSAQEPGALLALLRSAEASREEWKSMGERGFDLYQREYRAEEIYPRFVQALESTVARRYP